MNLAEQSELLQVLHGRREAIADAWYKAIARTSHVPHSAAEVREHLVELTEQAITLLLTEPFEYSQAQAIGASLVRFHYVQSETLGRTQEVLVQQLAEDLSADQVAALQPRLVTLLGGVATGFFQRACEEILSDQERIRGALIRELRQAQAALREVYYEVKQQVQERTAELRATNESLQREITERKRAEEAMQESTEKYRTLVEQSLQGLVVVQDFRIVFANAIFADISGYTIEELLSLSPEGVRAMVHSEDQTLVWGRLQDRLVGKLVPPRYEYRGIQKDGTVRWLEMFASRIEYRGKPAVQGAIIDITERKRVEEALRESEETARVLLNALTYVAALVDTRGIILDVNETMAQKLGKPVEELIGVCGWDLIPPDVAERRKAYADQAIQSGKPIRFEDERDGVCFDNVFYPVLDTHGKVAKIALLAGDITERKRAEEELERYRHHLEELVEDRTAELRSEITERKQVEEALKASEERYRSLFEGVPVGLYRTTREGQILDFNLTLVQMLGYPDRRSLSAVNVADLYVDPEDRRQQQSLLEQAGVLRDFETELHHHDGTVIWVRDSARAVRHADGQVWCYEGALEDITKRKRVEEELIRLSSAVKTSVDGIVIMDVEGKVTYVNEAALKMYGTDDKEDLVGRDALDLIAPEQRERGLAGIGFVLEKGYDRSRGYDIITRDGSRIPVEMSAAVMKDADGKPMGIVNIARDITERKQMEEHMMRTERLAAMGRLAAALAHEINNPLQAIGSNLELALDFPLKEEERQGYLQAARREIERLMALSHRMLHFARPPQFKPQPTPVADVVRYALALTSKQLDDSDIRVSLDLPDVIPLVLTSSSYLSQVFLNLMINAIEAMPDGGELSIVVRLAGDKVEVTFTDNGPGIPADAMARLFEPFYTMKENGTGLGLTTCHSIIQQHGGTITAGNAPGGGAVFTVALPIAPSDKPHLAESR